MTTVQIRIDEDTKNRAKDILNNLGLDMSTAIKVYFQQIIINKGIPFKLLTENGLIVEEEQEILKASEEAQRGINIVRTHNWKETKALLDSLKSK